MDLQIYQTVLYQAGGINLILAFVLLYNNYEYRNYEVYRRSRVFSTLVYAAFAFGFLIHAHFEWRTICSEAATALSVSYFHIGAVLFGWSHTSLMKPDYMSRRIVLRDVAILFLGLTGYWLSVAWHSHFALQLSLIVFFLHATFITLIFYRTYYIVRRNIEDMPANENAPRWWTLETKRRVLNRHHSFVLGCHLIVFFGLGSIVVTACFPTEIFPYTILSIAGMIVFCYIFYSLAEYGRVIEAGTCATEDALR